TGAILMFLDDDDTWENTKIADQINIFENDKEAGLVFTGKIFVRESNRNKIVRISMPKKEGFIFREMLFSNVPGSTTCVALRRDVFFNAGMFDESLKALQDYDLWLRCARITKIRHDGKANLRYTLQSSAAQISKNVVSKIESIEIIKEKLLNDYRELTRLEKR